MGFMDKMMRKMMEGMSPDQKVKMMDEFLGDMFPDEKIAVMEEMMPKMMKSIMSGGEVECAEGMFGMIADMVPQ